jgi:antitoxin CptB
MALNPSTASAPANALLDERALSKLRWRCRRGLLENDLLIEKFFVRHEASLTVGQADNDLLDLLLQRISPADLPDAQARSLASSSEARLVLSLLTPAAASSAHAIS